MKSLDDFKSVELTNAEAIVGGTAFNLELSDSGDIGASDFDDIGPSDFRDVGPSDFQDVGPSDHSDG